MIHSITAVIVKSVDDKSNMHWASAGSQAPPLTPLPPLDVRLETSPIMGS